ncbi:ABC transporter ATP-binding protein [Methylomonas sp. MK1]|uniref:ABC transporter ATP-binding protein n=1 Tax=Methylomonas sp. MK1 TaxID=1131552 RepID=UPI0003711F37|nr:ABC transporter ATP-binding protein [Methylomonas sp. MK1]
MSDIAISVENVGKIFRIYDHPGDRLKEAFSLSRKKFHTDYPALKDVSFQVKKGEFLGIVGKNGAGKSTLLKVLSREITPTSGRVAINGNVSLLQLGVGFDPEQTGVENARFASKLLGYDDDEIEGMMEEIIAFADIGDFVYRPVKTYSSGMYSRLSFAVGININPDILIADEVLAVGDMRFSQKCLRKMREFKEQGKTIIFVSHDIQSINVFCDNAIWMKDGEILMYGESKRVTTSFQNYMLFDKLPDDYNGTLSSNSSLQNGARDNRPHVENSLSIPIEACQYAGINWLENLRSFPCVGDGRVEIQRMAFILNESRKSVRFVQGNEDVILILDILAKAPVDAPQIGWLLYNRQGAIALHTNNDICGKSLDPLKEGERIIATFHFTLPSLANGNYIFSIGLQSHNDIAHKIDDVYEFSVARNDVKRTQCGYVIIEKERFEATFSS